MTSELKVASATCEAKPGFGPRAPGQPSNCVGPTIAPSKAKSKGDDALKCRRINA